MTTKKKSLGRGLDALLGKPEVKKNEAETNGLPLMLPVKQIKANPNQPRKNFNEKELRDLAASIENKGIIEPLVVQKLDDQSYQLIAGERRLRAAILAKIDEVPVIIREINNGEQERLELALIENILRENLNPIEEAEAFALLEKKHNLTHQKIGELTGRERSTVTNSMRLLKLPAHIQDDVRYNRLSAGHGRAMTALINQENMDEVRAEIISKSLSVRQSEALVKRLNKGKPKRVNEDSGDQAYFDDLAKSFTQSLGGLKVNISHAQKVKKLEIFYNNNDGLEFIMRRLGVAGKA